MKNILATLLFLFITSVTFCQNLPCTITFSDGEMFEGFSKITKKEKILFRLDENSTPDSYGPNEVTKIEFYEKKKSELSNMYR